MDVNWGSYVCLRLSNLSTQRLAQWLQDNDIPNPMDPADMHITVCYSRQPIQFTPMGLIPPMPVKPIGFDLFGKNKDYLVLRVASQLAENRNALAMMSGATTDFPEYKPHISLAKNTGLESVEDLPLVKHMLYANREEYTVLDPSFSGNGPAPRINPRLIRHLVA